MNAPTKTSPNSIRSRPRNDSDAKGPPAKTPHRNRQALHRAPSGTRSLLASSRLSQRQLDFPDARPAGAASLPPQSFPFKSVYHKGTLKWRIPCRLLRAEQKSSDRSEALLLATNSAFFVIPIACMRRDRRLSVWIAPQACEAYYDFRDFARAPEL